MARILLVDDDRVARAIYGDFLVQGGHQVTTAEGVQSALALLSGPECFDAVVTDLLLGDGDGMQVLEWVKNWCPGTEVIVITALGKVDPAVRAIKGGAAEYLVKPLSPEALQHAVERALTTRQLLRENEQLRDHVSQLETAWRIATTLDRARLGATAAAAIAHHAGARAAVIFLRHVRDGFRADGSHGFSDEPSARTAAHALRPHLARVTAEAPLALRDLAGFPHAVVLAAPEGDELWGHAALLFDGPPLSSGIATAQFLARYLGLAARNLGRFAEVEDLAYLDDLTHLFNLRYLHQVLEREVEHARAQGGSFSLLFLDLDRFKAVNDTHGHQTGSRLLVEVAKLISGCVREQDVAVRYGGDEYVVLLRGTDSGGALKVAERIRRTVEAHPFLSREGLGLHLTTCIGVATFPEHAEDKGKLIDFADRAMYRGKKTTRNVVYMAARGLEATPPERHSEQTGGPPDDER